MYVIIKRSTTKNHNCIHIFVKIFFPYLINIIFNIFKSVINYSKFNFFISSKKNNFILIIKIQIICHAYWVIFPLKVYKIFSNSMYPRKKPFFFLIKTVTCPILPQTLLQNKVVLIYCKFYVF